MTRLSIGLEPDGRIEVLPRLLIMWRDEEGPITVVSIHWLSFFMALTSFKQDEE
jgi:hypothetical protein